MVFRIIAPVSVAVALVAWTGRPALKDSYTAHMTGAQETPATGVAGTGTANFTLEGKRLTYTISVTGLSGPPTMAHIHVGAIGTAGPPVYTFALTSKVASGTIAHGTIDLAKPASAGVSGDSLTALLKNGNAYVNVHTAAHAGGEIRGQITKR